MVFLFTATGITIVVFIFLLMPFFVGSGGSLAPAASVNDIDLLNETRKNIIDRFVSEQTAHSEKRLSDSVWRRRREFLENKYIDVSRRLDFLNRIKESQNV